MPQPEWEALEREVHELRQRVAFLEQHMGLSALSALSSEGAAPADAAVSAPANPAESVPQSASNHPLADVPGALPIVGRALLGLAGAYLLRAITESGTLSARVGTAAGIAYALLWLGWAARIPATERLRTAIDSLTAVLILSPLLWEATTRFHAISPWTAAAILLVFAVFGMAISWRKSLLIVSTFATLAALGTAAALLLATHDVLPFTFLFLAVAAAIEASACLEHWLSERWLGATAADLSVLLATWLVTNERGLPQGYAPIPHAWLIAAQVALLTIYLSSTIVRTLFRGFSFTSFETAQCAVAFAVGLSGGLQMAPVMAGVMLVCAAACYLVSFALLERKGASSRNFYTYSTFGILLALGGSRILLSGATAGWVWSVLAIACIWAGGSFGRLTLEVHGGIYLLLALASSGALQEATALLLGAGPWPGERQVALWTGLAATAAAYALVAHYSRDDRREGHPTWNMQVFRIAVAASFVGMAAGIAAGALTGLYHLAMGADATHAYCATLRTGTLAGLSLLLAWAGPRWNRAELSRLIYPAMLLGGYRLVVEDLHEGHKGALFLSLLLYGAVLMALPRLKRSAG
ncbi:MAG: hypothetical protein ACLQU1_25185 [Bryobacteraceae bacterium]